MRLKKLQDTTFGQILSAHAQGMANHTLFQSLSMKRAGWPRQSLLVCGILFSGYDAGFSAINTQLHELHTVLWLTLSPQRLSPDAVLGYGMASSGIKPPCFRQVERWTTINPSSCSERPFILWFIFHTSQGCLAVQIFDFTSNNGYVYKSILATASYTQQLPRQHRRCTVKHYRCLCHRFKSDTKVR
jgi:hypothetical protein